VFLHCESPSPDGLRQARIHTIPPRELKFTPLTLTTPSSFYLLSITFVKKNLE
jgi:hypothetical protein